MQWWAWIAVGAILLGSELAFVDAQFYLVFVGVSAFVVGLLALTGLELAMWLQWLIFAVLPATSMLPFRRRIYERMRRVWRAVKGGPAGETVTVAVALPLGETCRLEYRGGCWSAINGGKSVSPAGSQARIARVDGLTLVVHGDA